MSNTTSWQLDHLSDLLPAGDYSRLKAPNKRVWGTRVIVPMPDRRGIMNHILLVQHTKPDRLPYWVLPGGGVDKGETPVEGGVRELQEELGLTIQAGKLVYIRLRTPQTVEFYMLATHVQGTPQLEPGDVHDVSLSGFDIVPVGDISKRVVYPVRIRELIQRDWGHWPTALYLGETP